MTCQLFQFRSRSVLAKLACLEVLLDGGPLALEPGEVCGPTESPEGPCRQEGEARAARESVMQPTLRQQAKLSSRARSLLVDGL